MTPDPLSPEQVFAEALSPPPVKPTIYREEDRKNDPEWAAMLAVEKAKWNAEVKSANEQILDIPLKFVIAGDEFQFTSRPLGYLHLIFAEFAKLGIIFSDIGKLIQPDSMANVKVEGDTVTVGAVRSSLSRKRRHSAGTPPPARASCPAENSRWWPSAAA